MTISTERLRKIASGSDFVADVGGKQSETVTEIARELLAVREAQSKPVALVDKRPFSNRVAWRNGGEKLQHGAELYTTPPAPAVPENVAAALDWIDDFIARCNGDDRGACNSVNVLRAAMLQPVSQGYTFDGLNIRAVSALRESVRNQWLKSEGFADKIYWKNMHSIANEIIEAMAAAPTPTK